MGDFYRVSDASDIIHAVPVLPMAWWRRDEI